MRRLAEVILGGGLDAVALIPVVDAVQVHLEDLVLRVVLVDLGRENDLAQFAAYRRLARLVWVQYRVAHELLCDGRGSRLALAGDVDEGRPSGCDRVPALMLAEVDVFGGECRVDGVLRDVLDM